MRGVRRVAQLRAAADAVEMGGAVLDAVPSVAEVRFCLPNKHHFLVDLSPFGLDNPNEVFHADDRP
jgi:urate oxidase